MYENTYFIHTFHPKTETYAWNSNTKNWITSPQYRSCDWYYASRCKFSMVWHHVKHNAQRLECMTKLYYKILPKNQQAFWLWRPAIKRSVYTYRVIEPESGWFKPNSGFNFPFSIYLTPNGLPFDAYIHTKQDYISISCNTELNLFLCLPCIE